MTSMKPGDLRVGLSYTRMGDKTPFMIVDVENDFYAGRHPSPLSRMVLILLSDGRVLKDTVGFIKYHTVPIEK